MGSSNPDEMGVNQAVARRSFSNPNGNPEIKVHNKDYGFELELQGTADEILCDHYGIDVEALFKMVQELADGRSVTYLQVLVIEISEIGSKPIAIRRRASILEDDMITDVLLLLAAGDGLVVDNPREFAEEEIIPKIDEPEDVWTDLAKRERSPSTTVESAN